MPKPKARTSLADQILRRAVRQPPPAPPVLGQPCDCLNVCGDDPWLKDGRSKPCPERQAIIDRARVASMKRDPDNPKAIIVTFDKEPSDADLSRAYSILAHGR